ncbi:PepSY domain-containing protein [Flammeovirga sp. MY04]|uniref:PepSY-associated TM helix domain-containing protein n=1 Tax=Flammeovirga sp. MY04 TaxID=1191459 RepID=UPI0008062C1B|nr:PepSY-associated TM helix domain-containing protein [Flammeovirga sp. MY04]ANQ51940.1 PepSY domain-containing protein [Flammeovirga sp. MY04]
MRKKLWALHSWIGLYTGLFIGIVSITGALAVFKFEIDEMLRPDLFFVTPKELPKNINEGINKVLDKYPENNGYRINVPKNEDRTWKVTVYLDDPNSPAKITQEVYLNPYTNTIVGERNMYRSFSFFIRNIHVRLFEGLYGRQWVGFFGLLLTVSLIISIFLYFDFTKKQRFGQVRSKNNRVKYADLHKFIGLATIVIQLIIAITGTWLGFQPKLEKPMLGHRPGKFIPTEFPIDKTIDQTKTIDYLSVLQATKKNFPDMVPDMISPSKDGSNSVIVFGDIPNMPFERHTNFVALEKDDYHLLKKFDIRESGFGGHVYYMQEALHFGDFGGIVLKVVYCLMGLICGFLCISGFFIYFKRTEKKRTKKYPLLTTSNIIWGFTITSLLWFVSIGVSSVTLGATYPTTYFTTPLFYGLIIVYFIYRLIRRIKNKSKGTPSNKGKHQIKVTH